MKSYYECHITMDGDPRIIEPIVRQIKWKFSQIHGDTVYKKTVKCYATRHFNLRIMDEGVQTELHKTADQLTEQGIKVLRRKVERVIYDDRIKAKCTGGCIECHLDDL